MPITALEFDDVPGGIAILAGIQRRQDDLLTNLHP
jgi:hypothetical protein